MSVRFQVLAASALVATLHAATSALADPATLGGDALQAIVPGAHIELDTPLKTVVPIRFSPDGLMTGEANGLGSYLGSNRDRGRWRIAGDQLCLKWFRWFDAEERCLHLRRDDQRIYWQEVGGESGTATLVTSGEQVAKATTRFAFATAGSTRQSPEPLKAVPDQPDADEKALADTAAASPAAPADATAPAPASAVTADLANLTIISRAEAATPPPAASVPAAPPALQAAAVTMPAKHTGPPSPDKLKAARIDKPVAPAKDRTAKRQTRVSSAAPASDPLYQVAHVDDDDVLNVREGPSEDHEAIAEIPADGRGVRIVGPCQADWCPISHGDTKGWVNRYYLEADAKPTAALARQSR